MPRHSRAFRLARPLALAVALGVTASASTDAQPRPSIPEVACTRVTVVALPGAGAHQREITLRIINDDPGGFPAHLRPEVEVETQVHGQWQRVSVAGFRMRADCRDRAESCVTLAPRSSLTIVPWTGMLGDGQCNCTRCAPAPAGTYRFVVRTCADCFSPTEAHSAPFTLPPT